MKKRISITGCRHAIQITERGYEPRILLEIDGEERMITEVKTGGAGNPRWFSGELRFTAKEQERLTSLARAIIKESRKTKRQLPLPYFE